MLMSDPLLKLITNKFVKNVNRRAEVRDQNVSLLNNYTRKIEEFKATAEWIKWLNRKNELEGLPVVKFIYDPAKKIEEFNALHTQLTKKLQDNDNELSTFHVTIVHK